MSENDARLEDTDKTVEDGAIPRCQRMTCGLGSERGGWSGSLAFVSAVLNYNIGFGNFWGFPLKVYKYGGSAFMVVYWLSFFLSAFPIFFLELALGQFSGRSPIRTFQLQLPAAEGVGIIVSLFSVIASIFYTAQVAQAFSYVFLSGYTPMHWETCNNPWNSNVRKSSFPVDFHMMSLPPFRPAFCLRLTSNVWGRIRILDGT